MVVRSKEGPIGMEDIAELESSLKNNNQTLVMWGNPRVIYDIQCVTDALCKRKHWDLCLSGRGKGHFVLETVSSKTSPVLMFPTLMPTNWVITLNSVVQRQDYFRFKGKAWYGLCWLQSNSENENKTKQKKTAYSSNLLLSQAHF